MDNKITKKHEKKLRLTDKFCIDYRHLGQFLVNGYKQKKKLKEKV